MESNSRIKEGEWFCAIEGLAILDKVYDFILRNMTVSLKIRR